MTPYELLLSESQERMLLVAQAGREDEVQAVFRRWGLEAVVVGRVTDDGRMRVRWHGEHGGGHPGRSGGRARAPSSTGPTREPADLLERQKLDPAAIAPESDWNEALRAPARHAEPRLEGLALPPVRPAGAGRHADRPRRRRRAGADQARRTARRRARRSRWRSTATRAGAGSIRTPAPSPRWRRRRATSRAPARVRWR